MWDGGPSSPPSSSSSSSQPSSHHQYYRLREPLYSRVNYSTLPRKAVSKKTCSFLNHTKTLPSIFYLLMIPYPKQPPTANAAALAVICPTLTLDQGLSMRVKLGQRVHSRVTRSLSWAAQNGDTVLS
ncbi:hypothetical protein PoB_003586000 [Plakobranchus ocellatus]|uniref:Uncharacterized protein n=1 Tax=Plakobranchus ocellatus TaxID=259542 RepID=A0AAV4AMC1_9GAST|nr:hypothetical protein PoB_003586000 [Plakobranchus ocellatus]